MNEQVNKSMNAGIPSVDVRFITRIATYMKVRTSMPVRFGAMEHFKYT